VGTKASLAGRGTSGARAHALGEEVCAGLAHAPQHLHHAVAHRRHRVVQRTRQRRHLGGRRPDHSHRPRSGRAQLGFAARKDLEDQRQRFAVGR
jgi:hypothetical protein